MMKPGLIFLQMRASQFPLQPGSQFVLSKCEDSLLILHLYEVTHDGS